MNEELQTINGELQIKLDDLALAQSDMQNLLNSTDIATLFLDKDLNVRRFTDQVTRIIHIREVDIGRPLSDLASTLNYPELHDDAKETLRTLAFSEKQISTTDGHWFTVRIMPYRTVANVIQGAVITFVDITAAKELESRLRRVQDLAPQGDGVPHRLEVTTCPARPTSRPASRVCASGLCRISPERVIQRTRASMRQVRSPCCTSSRRRR